MPANAVTRQARLLEMTQRLLEGEALPSSVGALGETASQEESVRHARALSAHIGPVAAGAAAALAAEYIQQNEEDPIALEAPEAEPPLQIGNENEQQPQQANMPVELAEEENALIAVAGALAPRINENVEILEGAKWHSFLNLVPNRHVANQQAKDVFGIFPCFDALTRTNRDAAVSGIKVALSVKAPEQINTQAQRLLAAPQVRMMQEASTEDQNMEEIATWLKDNAATLSSKKVTFPEMLPGYTPKIMFAVSEDETFLLVVENTGLADYSFDAEEKEIIITAKGGKLISNGDLLEVITLDKADLEDADLDAVVDFSSEYLSLMPAQSDDENKVVFNLYYSSPDPFDDEGLIQSQLISRSETPGALALRDAIAAKFDPLGSLDAGRGGNSPLDGRYIYSWPGGRQYYAQNPNSMTKLAELMSGEGALEIRMGRLAREQQEQTIENAPEEPQGQPADIAQVPQIPAAEPVVQRLRIQSPTTSAKHLTSKTKSGSIRPLSILRATHGFVVRDIPSQSGGFQEKAAVLEKEGSIFVVTPTDGKKLPIAKSFKIETRSTLAEPGEALGEFTTSFTEEDLNTLISQCISPDGPVAGMRM